MSCKIDEKKMVEKDGTPQCSAHSKVQIPKIKKITASHNKLFQPLTSRYAAPTFSSLNRHRNSGDMMYVESIHAFTDRTGSLTSRNAKATKIPSPNYLNKIDFNKPKTPNLLTSAKNINQFKTPSSLRSGYSVHPKISENRTKEKKVFVDTCNTPKTSSLYVSVEKENKFLYTKRKNVSTTRKSPENYLFIQRERRSNKATFEADQSRLCDSTKNNNLKVEDVNESETNPPKDNSITLDKDSVTLVEEHCFSETSLSSVDQDYLLHHQKQRRSRNFERYINMREFLDRSSEKQKTLSSANFLKEPLKENVSCETLRLNGTGTSVSPKPCTLLTSKKFTTLEEEKKMLKPWDKFTKEKQVGELTERRDLSLSSSPFQKVQCVHLAILDSRASRIIVGSKDKQCADLFKKSNNFSTSMCNTLTQEPEFSPSRLSIVSPEGDTECEFLENHFSCGCLTLGSFFPSMASKLHNISLYMNSLIQHESC